MNKMDEYLEIFKRRGLEEKKIRRKSEEVLKNRYLKNLEVWRGSEETNNLRRIESKRGTEEVGKDGMNVVHS